MKSTEIYASSHAVSAAADHMVELIEKLSQAGFTVADQAQFRVACIEEIRAMTCHDVNMHMDSSELANAASAEKSRLAIERKWAKIAGVGLSASAKMTRKADKRKSRKR